VSRNEPTKENPLFDVESKPYEPKLVNGDRLSFKLRANPVQLAKKERSSNEIEAWRRSREQRRLKEKQPTKKRIRNDVVMDAQHRLLRELADHAMVKATGGKSGLKQRVLASWVASNNQDITAMLKGTLEQNERYREFLEQKLSPPKLFDLAFKAAIDLSLETWLIEKGKTKGFTVVQDEKKKRLMFQAVGYQWHSLPKKGRTAGFSSVDFEGEVEVIDPTSFIETLFTGIGPAKAFGCGLMLVRRI
jgi:CRISPR system Cascade subunit CasE